MSKQMIVFLLPVRPAPYTLALFYCNSDRGTKNSNEVLPLMYEDE